MPKKKRKGTTRQKGPAPAGSVAPLRSGAEDRLANLGLTISETSTTPEGREELAESVLGLFEDIRQQDQQCTGRLRRSDDTGKK